MDVKTVSIVFKSMKLTGSQMQVPKISEEIEVIPI